MKSWAWSICPTGMGSPDFYGVNRTPETDRFSSAVVALDADTGEVRWVFQTIHHDLWDYDNAAQPVLMDFPTRRRPGAGADRSHQDRPGVRAGSPHRKAADPGGGAAGASLHHSGRALVAHPTLLDRHAELRRAKSDGSRHVGHHALRPALLPDQVPARPTIAAITPPPRLGPSIRSPGELGGIDWGSVSVDEGRGILVVNSNLMADYDRFIPRAQADAEGLYINGDPRRRKTAPGAAMAGTPYGVHWTGFLTRWAFPASVRLTDSSPRWT